MKKSKVQKSYFSFLTKQHYNFAIVIFIAQLLAAVLPLISSLREDYSFYYIPTTAFYAYGLLGVAIAGAVVAPFMVFGYMFKANNMDYYFSLPVRKSKVYFKQIVFSYLLVALPTVLTSAVIAVALQIMKPLVPELMSTVYMELLMVVIVGLLGILVFMMPAVISTLSSADVFNAMIYTVVIHLIPLWPVLARILLVQKFHGNTFMFPNDNPEDKVQDLIPHVSFFKSVPVSSEGGWPWRNIWILVLWTVIALVLVIYGANLYHRFRASRVGSSYQVKKFYPVMTFYTGVMIFLLVYGQDFLYRTTGDYHMNINEHIIFFATVFVGYYLIRLIQDRGFPKLKEFFASFAIILVIGLLGGWIIGGLIPSIRARQIPNEDRISKVEVYIANTSASYVEYEESVDDEISPVKPEPGTDEDTDEAADRDRELPSKKTEIMTFGGYIGTDRYYIGEANDADEIGRVMDFHKERSLSTEVYKFPGVKLEHYSISYVKLVYYDAGEIISMREYEVVMVEIDPAEELFGIDFE